jgi:hypothetical protein
MTDWRTAIRDVVEQDAQDSLSTDAAKEMRRVVIAAAANRVTERSKSSWMRRPVFVAATAVAIIAGGVAAGLRLDLSIDSKGSGMTSPAVIGQPGSVSDAASAGEPNRQLQFLTPGGTRIIWVFNSDLDLKATLR